MTSMQLPMFRMLMGPMDFGENQRRHRALPAFKPCAQHQRHIQMVLQASEIGIAVFPRAVAVKPVIDDRSRAQVIQARTGESIEDAVSVESLDEIEIIEDGLTNGGTLVFVDEAQFFGESLLRL